MDKIYPTHNFIRIIYSQNTWAKLDHKKVLFLHPKLMFNFMV